LKKVYFISGLGADKRAFSFLDLTFCEPIFIEWIAPLSKETLSQYALRLKEQINDAAPIIVGVSFGGMLATEIAKTNPAAKVIIISSNKVKKEFPRLLLIGKYIPAYKWMPLQLIKRGAAIQQFFFNPKGEKQKMVFNTIINESDTHFTRWAIEAILKWENKEVPENLIHIHGTADKLLPFRLVKENYAIKDGTHLMIMNNASEITELLRKLI
jgi:pimeloyl-ACP methyl ester carboxylesterase